MHFDLTDDQKMLQDTVTTFVKKESPITRLRKLRENPVGWEKPVWKRMGDMGWLSLPFPESVGGFGGSAVEVALVLEQFGTTLVPEPYVASVVLAGMAVLRAGTKAQHDALLTPMIAGDTSLALAVTERDSRHELSICSTRAEKKGSGWALTGEKIWVLNGHAADTLIVSARLGGETQNESGGSLGLFQIPRESAGVRVTPVATMDGAHAAFIRFDGAIAERLGDGDASRILDEVMDLAAAAACAEGVGIMRTVLWMTVEYLRTREQFGAKIGTFQALQHRAVDMFVETELAKSTSIMAAIKAGDADPAERAYAISQAKVQLSQSGRFVTQQAIQLHGGIGVTDEHDVGLYFKRMHVLNSLYGDEDHHLARFTSMPQFTQV